MISRHYLPNRLRYQSQHNVISLLEVEKTLASIKDIYLFVHRDLNCVLEINQSQKSYITHLQPVISLNYTLPVLQYS